MPAVHLTCHYVSKTISPARETCRCPYEPHTSATCQSMILLYIYSNISIHIVQLLNHFNITQIKLRSFQLMEDTCCTHFCNNIHYLGHSIVMDYDLRTFIELITVNIFHLTSLWRPRVFPQAVQTIGNMDTLTCCSKEPWMVCLQPAIQKASPSSKTSSLNWSTAMSQRVSCAKLVIIWKIEWVDPGVWLETHSYLSYLINL